MDSLWTVSQAQDQEDADDEDDEEEEEGTAAPPRNIYIMAT